MIKVMLKDGQVVEVPKGLKANFNKTTRNLMRDEVVETTLDVSDTQGYGGNTIASFKASEVIGFTSESEEDGGE